VGNIFAKFFAINKDQRLAKSKTISNSDDFSSSLVGFDDLPAGAEYVDEDCEGCECDGGGDCGGD
jgi:hypothetical protein